jgi:hypothetical protein
MKQKVVWQININEQEDKEKESTEYLSPFYIIIGQKQSIIFLGKKSAVQDVFTLVLLSYNLYAEKSKAVELVIY